MAKISINLPDGYVQALDEWSIDLGEKKGTLAAQLVRLCLESKHPDRFPQAPAVLPGDKVESKRAATVPAEGTLVADLLKMASNIEGGAISPEALITQALTAHFTRLTQEYHTKIKALAAKQGLTFEQAYVLLTNRTYPYNEQDVEWAKKQPPVLTEEQFLKGTAERGHEN